MARVREGESAAAAERPGGRVAAAEAEAEAAGGSAWDVSMELMGGAGGREAAA